MNLSQDLFSYATENALTRTHTCQSTLAEHTLGRHTSPSNIHHQYAGKNWVSGKTIRGAFLPPISSPLSAVEEMMHARQAVQNTQIYVLERISVRHTRLKMPTRQHLKKDVSRIYFSYKFQFSFASVSIAILTCRQGGFSSRSNVIS